MFELHDMFPRRAGNTRRPDRIRRKSLILEGLEDRRVPTSAVSTGMASILAPSAFLASIPKPPPVAVNHSASLSTASLPGFSFLPSPSISSIHAVSASEIDLTWTRPASTGLINYQVEYSSDGGRTWTGTSATTALGQNIQNLNANTSYLFEVDASNTQTVSSWSAARSASTFPSAPVFTVRAASSTELDLTWNAVPGPAAAYQVSVASYFDGQLQSKQDLNVPSNSGGTSYLYKLPNLAFLEYYVISVGASNASGTTWSASQTASTDLVLFPTLTKATAISASEVDLAWNGVYGATGYQVQYSSNAGASWASAPSVSGTSDAIMGLKPGTAYTFRVNAFNTTASSSWSNTLSATTFPAAPTLTGKATSTTEIDLAWGPVASASEYYVQESTNNGATWSSQVFLGAYSDAIRGLSPGATYEFRVGASNASGTTFSNVLTLPTLPSAPTLTARAVSSSEIDLSWNAVNGATQYVVLEEFSPGILAPIYFSPNSSTTSIQNTKLSPDTTYTFEVAAVNASGGSDSSLVSATTLAGAPATLKLQPSSTTITAGGSVGLTVTALDANGKPCNNVDVVVTSSAGLNDIVTITNGVGTLPSPITLSTPGVVHFSVTFGASVFASASVNVQAPSQTSTTWSGYAASPGSGVTGVGATWVQPKVTGSNGAEVGEWVGIDGFGGSTVEQCGVGATIVNGSAQYYAWYEFYGDQSGNSKGPDYSSQAIAGFSVNSGDVITAAVSLVAGTTRSFIFRMTDQPASGGKLESFFLEQTMQYVTPKLATAECIVENPNYGNQHLANFGTINFSGVWATVNGTTDALTDLQNAYALSIEAANIVYAEPTNPPDVVFGTVGNEPASGKKSSSFSVSYV